jgi:hypothetical protein
MNHLLQNIKNLSWNVKNFKLTLKRFLLMGSFYSVDECFGWISRSGLGTFTYAFLKFYKYDDFLITNNLSVF